MTTGYRDQLERMRRALARAEAPSGNKTEKEDDFVTFFLHCWHLKDWVKHDKHVDEAARAHVHDAVHKDDDLRAVQELANGLKHLVPKKVEMRGHNDLVLVVGDPNPARVHPLVTRKDGTQQRAIDLARRAVARWEAILTAAGLPIS